MADTDKYTKEYIPVLHDAFNIIDRVKEVDSSYFILLNRNTQKFEVHSSAQRDTFCLELPFDFLDARSLTYIRKYRRERAKEIFAEIDRENELLEKREKSERYNGLCLAMDRFLSKGGSL